MMFKQQLEIFLESTKCPEGELWLCKSIDYNGFRFTFFFYSNQTNFKAFSYFPDPYDWNIISNVEKLAVQILKENNCLDDCKIVNRAKFLEVMQTIVSIPESILFL